MVTKIHDHVIDTGVHCQISGFPIKEIIHLKDGRYRLEGMVRYISYDALVSKEYMTTHRPKLGGYFIQHPNRNQDYLPADEFEAVYQEYTDSELEF